jgi:hypothetical protein
MNVAMAGVRVDSGFGDVVSAAAEEVIPFGLVTVEDLTDPELCRLPGANQQVILDDGGTWTAGNLVSVVNGVTVTTAFATDKATSMAAHAAAIQALAFITTATYAGGSNTITVVADAGVRLTITTSVAGITGTMTITSTTDSLTDPIKGISLKTAREYGSTRAYENDRVLMTLSGDTITTSDTIDGNFNGVAMATVTYATSEAATLQLIANAIMEINGIVSAVVSGRTILVSNSPGLVMERASLTVTDNALASVAPSFAATYSKQDIGLVSTDVANLPGETVGNLRRGRVYVVAEEAIIKSNSVFVRTNSGTGTQRGAVRNDADSGSCVAVTTLRFAGPSVLASDGVTRIVPVEINLP